MISLLRKYYYHILYPEISIPQSAKLGRDFAIRMEGELASIIIGQNVSIGNHVLFGCGPGKIVIGDNSIIRDNCVFSAAEDIVIGENTYIAENVSIRTGNHGYSTRDLPYNQQAPACKPIVVGSECFIEKNVVVLGGATIGDSEYVSTAVVTSS